MPGRKFPGVVIQSDTLSTFISDTRQIVAELRVGRRPLDDAQCLADGLAGLLDHYAHTLAAHGIDLPYIPEA